MSKHINTHSGLNDSSDYHLRRAKKSLGQHFLNDVSVRDLIIEASCLSTDDTVIEVGPGTGVLTEELVKRASNVIAVELDTRLALRLQHALSYCDNLTIINEDILNVGLDTLANGSYKVVANIPYYITSPILHHFITAEKKPSLMVMMMQREVAEAIVVRDHKMTALAVSMHVYSLPEIITYVPARCFSPNPRVDSAVVRFTMLPMPAVLVDSEESFLQIVRYGFRSPRKQLRNSLAYGLDIPASEAFSILQTAGINPTRRAESLRLDEWKTLYDTIMRNHEIS